MRGTGHSEQADDARRADAPAVIAGVAAALLLGLSLAYSVTAAAQTNPPGTILVLEELVKSDVRCTSSSAVCTGVNLYGGSGDTDPPQLHPGDQLTTSVQLRNAGTIAAGLDLSPGACRQETSSGGTAAADLCGTVTVAVACVTPDGSVFASGPRTLTRFGQDGPLMVTAGLDPGASTMCDFTVTYPADAPPATRAHRAWQPVTWTLLATEAVVAGSDTERPPAAPAVAPPAAPRGGTLPVTGGAGLPLALAGLALSVAGAVLCGWWPGLRTSGAAAGRARCRGVLVVVSRASRAAVRHRR
jgi:hypothetical protein